MTRVILLGCMGMLAACASGPPDLPPGSGFPREASIDPRLFLNGSDRTQIARLVAAQTPARIKMVWRAGAPDKIMVTCGRADFTQPQPWTNGSGFLMQRFGATWKITGTIAININPTGPGVEPIEVGSGVRTY